MTKKVIPFDKQKVKSKEVEKLSKVDSFRALLDGINKSQYAVVKPAPFMLRLVKMGDIMRLAVEEAGEVMRPIDDQEAVRLLRAYIENHVMTDPVLAPSFAAFDVLRINQLIDYLMASLPVTENVKPLRFLSDPGACWHRLDFDLIENPEPRETALCEFLGRCSSPQAVAQWLGSLFVEDSPRSQYLWLYGGGGEGKSTFVRFLARLLASGYRGRVVPNPNDRFWTASLLGARLVAFNDCNNYGFPSTGLFKSLTGDDLIQIEEKNKPIREAKIDAKFVFTSNERPSLSSEKADMRRAIYIEVAPLPVDKSDDSIDEKLWNDRQQIISSAVNLYNVTVTKSKNIVYDVTLLENLVSENEDIYSSFFEKYFEISDSYSYVTASRFTQLLEHHFKSRHEQKQCREWLKRKHNIQSKCHRDGKKVEKVYYNIRELTAIERIPVN